MENMERERRMEETVKVRRGSMGRKRLGPLLIGRYSATIYRSAWTMENVAVL